LLYGLLIHVDDETGSVVALNVPLETDFGLFSAFRIPIFEFAKIIHSLWIHDPDEYRSEFCERICLRENWICEGLSYELVNLVVFLFFCRFMNWLWS
jgi:hypothetical protein